MLLTVVCLIDIPCLLQRRVSRWEGSKFNSSWCRWHPTDGFVSGEEYLIHESHSLHPSIILCSLVVGIGIYIVMGIVVMRVRYQATGTDLIPNKNFWMSLPFLIKVLPLCVDPSQQWVHCRRQFLPCRMELCSQSVRALVWLWRKKGTKKWNHRS